MKLAPWTPLLNFPELGEDLGRWFDAPINGSDSTSTFMPKLDIVQTADALQFYADLPGFEKEDVSIEIEEGRLTLSGERSMDEEYQNSLVRAERATGSFTRTFRLPSHVDAAKAKASFKNGVLKLVLPKLEAAKPRKVEIEL